ncbi:MAG: glutathionylspermidine synthase family protein [Syntrophorhabdaceae bacterium]
MRRIKLHNIRDNWQSKVEEIGFYYHEIDGNPYWDESVYYEFTSDQIDHLEDVTNTLYAMGKKLVGYVFDNSLGSRMGIPEPFFELARDSWRANEPTIYGRFDFCWDGVSEPKLLEFNADTPTALFEASVVQYQWLQDMFPGKDQFNSIHEKLMDVLAGKIRRLCSFETFYTSSVQENLEDLTTTEYMRDIATQAGLKTEHIYIDDIGYDNDNRYFVDLNNGRIRCMFKLYPWEWLVREEFGPHLLEKNITLLEPAWKMILSNKAILPILWEMYPGHKNLLPAYFEPRKDSVTYVEKPFFSREGENISVRAHFTQGKPGSIYQEFHRLPEFAGNYPVIGSWVIGDEAAGMGIREDTNPITNNLSRFVPHLFE